MKRLYASALIGLFVISIFSGCGTETKVAEKEPAQTKIHERSPEAARLIQEGGEAYGRFNYDRAVDLYSQALTIDENDYTALSGAGIALAMRGNATRRHPKDRKSLDRKPRRYGFFLQSGTGL